MKHLSFIRGITILETLIALAIITLVVALILPSLTQFRNEQSLKNTAENILALLNEARIDTLSSQNSTYYNVRFETSQAILYAGSTYSSGSANNKVVAYESNVTLPSGNISLAGSGSTVTFDRLTGDTDQYGTITIQLSSDATKQKTITINKTGVVSTN